MKKPPKPPKPRPLTDVAPATSAGLPMRLQLLLLIMGFIVVASFATFNTSYQFILREKESSLQDLQILRVEQVRSKIETRIEVLKGQVLESALRLLDSTRAKPELDEKDWEYLIADKARWISTTAAVEQIPAQAAPNLDSQLSIEMSPDKEWIHWSQGIQIASGASTRVIPVQAKFRSRMIFLPIEEFREGGLDLVLVKRLAAGSYDLLWGNPQGLENVVKVQGIDATLLNDNNNQFSKEVRGPNERWYLTLSPVANTPWQVISTVNHTTLVSGLSYMLANQGFWLLVIILLAVFVSVWFARRFSRPIESIVASSRLLETGDFAVRVSPSGPRELQTLGRAFNSMGQGLEDREKALRSAQDALIQNEKLAALGTLSAGIAHEVKNPLAGILGNADLLVGVLGVAKGSEKSLQYVEIIRKETRRCREIIESLMRFSRQEAAGAQKSDFDLELAAWDAVNLVEHSLNLQGVQIVKAFSPSPEVPLAHGVTNQVQQVLLNMLQNSGHAMETTSGKELTIGVETFATPTEASPGAFVALESTKLTGRVGRIWIRDQGIGMSPEVQRRIFEPFFTTKEAGKGTGLGLAVTMGILADHEVRLSIDSAPGAGTTFYIDFASAGPRTEEVQQKLQAMRSKAQGGETSAFDVAAEPVDLGLLGDDKPIALFEDEPTNVAVIHKEKVSSGFSVRKPKTKGPSS